MKTVMFTGDSITDCGRARPVGTGLGTLGNSYVGNIFVQTYAKDPTLKLKFLNTATSGDTSRQLLARFDAEVLAYHSDYLFIMIGVNDCWREFDTVPYENNAPSADEYRSNMKTMVEKALAAGTVPVFLSPYLMELSHENPMRAEVDIRNAILREIASEYGLAYIDIQARFDYMVSVLSSYPMSGDRVHPKAIGCQVIADTVMQSDIWKKILSEAV